MAAALVPGAAADDGARDSIRAVRSWAYQLQRVDVPSLAGSTHDLLVVDHANDDLVPWPRETVERLRARAGGRRLVLAYVSIGEAESYRAYWRPEWNRKAKRPKWIGPMNRQWHNNFPVRYWSPEWEQILLGDGGYVDEIVDQGFDGIYMDRLDVYTMWSPTGKGPKHAAEGARAMVRLVRAIARRAREVRKKSGFLLVSQNAAELALHTELLDVLDAVALEDMLYSRGVPRPKEIERFRRLLAPVRARGLPVLSVDYLAKKAAREKYEAAMRDVGFVPFAARSIRLDSAAP